jgi:hypothetical protein
MCSVRSCTDTATEGCAAAGRTYVEVPTFNDMQGVAAWPVLSSLYCSLYSTRLADLGVVTHEQHLLAVVL